MTLVEALTWLMSGGAGVVVYWLMENVAALEELSAAGKRYASLGLSVGLPVAAWLGLVGLGYAPAPETWQGWVEQVFGLAAGALLVGQGIHGAAKLRVRPESAGMALGEKAGFFPMVEPDGGVVQVPYAALKEAGLVDEAGRVRREYV